MRVERDQWHEIGELVTHGHFTEMLSILCTFIFLKENLYLVILDALSYK